MVQLHFKSGDHALEYIEKYFTHNSIMPNQTYYGVVKFIDKSGSPEVYMLEIIALKKSLLKSKTKRFSVAGIKHAELSINLEEGDLVIWGCLKKKNPFSSGVIVNKCELKMDESNSNFIVSNEINTNNSSYYNKDKIFDYERAEDEAIAEFPGSPLDKMVFPWMKSQSKKK